MYTKYHIKYSNQKERHTQFSLSHAAAQRNAAPCGAMP